MLALTGSSSAIVLGLGTVAGSGNVRVWKNSGADLAHVTAPTDGKWHHIAYTTSGSTDTLYVDGVATAGLGTSHDSGAVTAVFMGAASAGTSFYNGSLDDVRVYTRALSAREVADLAFGHAPSTGVATHTFSDAFTTTNGNDLVIASGIVAGTAAVTVGGDWFNYGGRFTNTTGTITLNSDEQQDAAHRRPDLRQPNRQRNGTYTTADRLWMPGATLNISGQASSLSPGATMTVGAINDTTGNSNGLQAGTPARWSSTAPAIWRCREKNFWGLRIEDPSETGLVSYWKLDEGQYTTVRDYSDGNSGTLSASGATWTSAPAGMTFDDAAAIKLNGTHGLGVARGPPPAFRPRPPAQTISLWFNLGSTSGTQDFIALGDGSHGIKIGLNGGVLAAFTWGGTSLITATTPAAGGWHNVVFSYDGTNNNFYLDGVAVDADHHRPPERDDHRRRAGELRRLARALQRLARRRARLQHGADRRADWPARQGALRRDGRGGDGHPDRRQDAEHPTAGFGFFLDSGNYNTNDQTVTVSAPPSPASSTRGRCTSARRS